MIEHNCSFSQYIDGQMFDGLGSDDLSRRMCQIHSNRIQGTVSASDGWNRVCVPWKRVVGMTTYNDHTRRGVYHGVMGAVQTYNICELTHLQSQDETAYNPPDSDRSCVISSTDDAAIELGAYIRSSQTIFISHVLIASFPDSQLPPSNKLLQIKILLLSLYGLLTTIIRYRFKAEVP